jgi:disulfide bond formation protein DsbB
MPCSLTSCLANHPRALAPLLLIIGTVPLAGALVSQYGFGLHPCDFCLYQRYPYAVVIGCGVLAFALRAAGLRARLLVALAMLALGMTAMLGLIHTGIERDWLDYAGGCVAQAAPGASIEDLRTAIAAAPLVSCAEVAFTFLGISMASWNVLYALAAAVFLGYGYRRKAHHD